LNDCATIPKARSIGSFASIIDELNRDEQGVTFLQILAFIASAGGNIQFNRAQYSYYTYILCRKLLGRRSILLRFESMTISSALAQASTPSARRQTPRTCYVTVAT